LLVKKQRGEESREERGERREERGERREERGERRRREERGERREGLYIENIGKDKRTINTRPNNKQKQINTEQITTRNKRHNK
jgi:hypothetical protein